MDDHIGALCFQFSHVVLSGNADHESESPSGTSLNAGDGVLDHDRSIRLHTQHLRRLQIGIRRRLAGKTLLRDDIAIDTRIEKIAHARRLQYGLAILTRGDYSGFNAAGSQRLEESHRARICFDTRSEPLVDQVVFPVAETANGFGIRRIRRCSFRQDDATRFKKIDYALIPWLSVDVKLIVGGDIEGTERLSVLLRPFL